MQNHEKVTKLIARRYIWLPLLLGISLGVLFFGIFTGYDMSRIGKIADETLDFMQERVKQYDNYKNNDKVKSLYRLADKTLELSQRLEEKENMEGEATENTDWKGMIDCYMKDQRLDGVLVYNERSDCVYQSDGPEKIKRFWQDEMNVPAVKDMLDYSRNTYITRLETEEEAYDFAVVSRSDKKGLVAAYIKKDNCMEDNGDISIYSLFTDFTFEKNGIVAVTDGRRVLSSNSEELLAVNPDEYQDIFTPDIYTGNEKKMIHLKSTGGCWYGEIKQVGDYTLYAFFPIKSVFALRTKAVICVFGIYILCWMTFMLIRGYVTEANMRQMEKQYHIIRSVSSVFSICMLFDLKKDTWEIIKASDRIREMIGNEKNTAKMLKYFCRNAVAQPEWTNFLDFVNPATISDRLKGKDYMNSQTQSVKGEWFTVMLVPQHYDPQGNVEAALFLSRNITDEKLREMDYQKKLEKSVEQAEQANVAKTDFLRRMSHDIRTPINGIRGMVDICRYYIGNPKKQEECLDKIMLSTTFLMELVNDVLDMNKLESGQIKLEEKPFSISEILKEVETVVGISAAEHGITLTVKTGEILHENLLGSSLHVRQILQNITSNAVKYNKTNGKVVLECRELPSENEKAMFEFVCTDNGIGMSPEFQKHAFEPFVQEKTSARTSYAGTGLGLAIVKKLAEQMEGTIQFVSEPGKGTQFTIRLPFLVDHTQEKLIQEKQDTDWGYEIKNCKILLVEDYEINMEIARFVLENEGAQVKEAWNGKEAVDIFAESKPGEIDVILMDLMMPVMGGLEATESIRKLQREDAKTIPIIAMTANAFADDEERSLAAGMDAHISKPLDAEQLIQVISDICRRRKD